MKNEPVAWMSIQEGIFSPSFKYLFSETKKQGFIPLYTNPVNTCKHGVDDGACKECYMESTHPVKELTLTEDEIDDVWAACSTGESDTIDMHLFAEAILKKAQEK